jgi:hypothetical protein
MPSALRASEADRASLCCCSAFKDLLECSLINAFDMVSSSVETILLSLHAHYFFARRVFMPKHL